VHRAFVVVALLVAGCPARTLLPGGDHDEHGCLGSGGYQWCARDQRCARPWELASEKGLGDSPAAFADYCSGSAAAPPIAAAPTGLARFLPDVAGFTAGPLETHPNLARRAYVRGDTRIGVTIAASDARPIDQWNEASADYPQIDLGVPHAVGSGFYACDAGTKAHRPCSGHLQFATGYHVELFGDGDAGKAELDDLLRGLPLRALATRP
jgi:hypothetical protein